MSLRQMEYLVAVHEEASFTRAAETLNVTQSALSHQIKALEREVGGELLERLPRGVRLTAMGRAFLPDAELAVRSARKAHRAAGAAAGAAGGELRIATLQGIAMGALPGALARMRAAHPGVLLVLGEYLGEEELLERVERGIADLALSYGPPPDWSGPVRTVGEEEVLLLVPREDPLCGKGSVALERLADREWIRCANEPVMEGRPFLDRVCEEAGFTPRTAVRAAHTMTSARLAAAGAGIALVPSCVAPLAASPEQLLRVSPLWRRPLTVFARAELTGAAEAFTDLLLETGLDTTETEGEDYAMASPQPDACSTRAAADTPEETSEKVETVGSSRAGPVVLEKVVEPVEPAEPVEASEVTESAETGGAGAHLTVMRRIEPPAREPAEEGTARLPTSGATENAESGGGERPGPQPAVAPDAKPAESIPETPQTRAFPSTAPAADGYGSVYRHAPEQNWVRQPANRPQGLGPTLRRAWQRTQTPELLLPGPGPHPLSIGRAAGSILRITHFTVSRTHAQLRHTAEGWRLRDLGSSNGTWVNGRRVSGVAHVWPGDRVSFGDVEFRLAAPWTSAPLA